MIRFDRFTGFVKTQFKAVGFWSCSPRKLKWACGEGRIYNLKGHDYAEFPAIQYFNEKYKSYPSTINYTSFVKHSIYEQKINEIKGLGFYAEDFVINFNYSYDHTAPAKSFVFLDVSKEGILLYITVNQCPPMKEKSQSGNEDLVCINVNIFYSNKDMSADKAYSIVKDDLLKIEEIIPNKEEERVLNLLVLNKDGYGLQAFEIEKPEIDFSLNYNFDFEEVNKLISERLSIDNSKGIVLLHGVAGAGKTTYIRHLINILKKRIIYVPPNMVNSISDPALLKFFISYPNSILVIEDAENVLSKRVGGGGQAVANILNLSDGLLSDIVNIQIVATFNTDISEIDDAILRKGRLICKYKFEELQRDRAEALAKKLGVELTGSHPLTDIYNAQEKSFAKKRPSIGFVANN